VPDTCAVGVNDVTCVASDDCRTFYRPGCALCGVFEIYGLSKTNTVRCNAPLCPPPAYQPPCVDAGFKTQDCAFVPNYLDVGVVCVKGQCMTVAIDGGLD
jgi:hypothetical protein